MTDRKPTIAEIRERVMSPVGVTWFGQADADSRTLLEMVDGLTDALRAEEGICRDKHAEVLQMRARIAELEAKLAEWTANSTAHARACRAWQAWAADILRAADCQIAGGEHGDDAARAELSKLLGEGG